MSCATSADGVVPRARARARSRTASASGHRTVSAYVSGLFWFMDGRSREARRRRVGDGRFGTVCRCSEWHLRKLRLQDFAPVNNLGANADFFFVHASARGDPAPLHSLERTFRSRRAVDGEIIAHFAQVRKWVKPGNASSIYSRPVCVVRHRGFEKEKKSAPVARGVTLAGSSPAIRARSRSRRTLRRGVWYTMRKKGKWPLRQEGGVAAIENYRLIYCDICNGGAWRLMGRGSALPGVGTACAN